MSPRTLVHCPHWHSVWKLATGAVGIVLALLVTSGCSDTAGQDDANRPSASPSSAHGNTPTQSGSSAATPSATPPSAEPTYDVGSAVSLPAYFDREFDGGDLRLGGVRERTSSYTSYDVTYRSQRWRISGVLNVPRGKGPFPAVVLAHGYIDPAVYFSGQGMPREREWLADAGYVALHTDYRNHAGSDDDPALGRNFRLGYAVDAINAVNALRATEDVPVDDNRVALMGRSMGGGVVYKALEMAPDLVDAGVVFAAVSSDEADNFAQFRSGRSSSWTSVERRWGRPAANPALWSGISARPYLDRITEPVLLQHGTRDTTCPPEWARATYRAMRDAGVDVQLDWYQGEGHTFEAQFDDAMRRTVRFLNRQLA